MLSRRSFLKFGAAAGIGMSLSWFGPTLRLTGRGMSPVVLAQISDGMMLDPTTAPKYQMPMLIPPAMPRAGKIKVKGGKNIDYYEIAMRQFQQQILPVGLPATTVWGYGPKVAQNGPAIFNAPSLTIEAKWNTPVRIKWINELVDANGNYLPHLLPVDPTLHWANPPGGPMGRDMRPSFSNTPDPYTGPVPIVTHVHGAVGVGDESDGYAEAWYLPAATNIPGDYAEVGTWYDFFKKKAGGKDYRAPDATPGADAWEPGMAVFQYPNTQRASTIWYHDHALGMTRLNVYAGPAGFFIIRGGPDDNVLDSRTGRPALLPGPAPALGDAPGAKYYEIPIAIQDRSFNSDGSLFYPNTRAFFDQIEGPFIPITDLSPIWNPEFFGNCIMVNGNTWPFLAVEQRRYRFRFPNGCDSRFLILNFSNIPGVEVWQIGNEGGFLAAPVNLTTVNGNRLLMGLAERADVIVDFSSVQVDNYVLDNVGPDEPFGGGEPDEDFDTADPGSTGQVMEFRVGPIVGTDSSTPPQFLQLPAIIPLTGGTTRPLALLEAMSEHFEDAPAEALLGTVGPDAINPTTPPARWNKRLWMDPVTENPAVGATEVWEFYNVTADAHPMHIHEVPFQVVNRQAILVDEEDETVAVVPGSQPRPPEPWENGWKDTVIAYPGEVTRLRMKFDGAGQFAWHCHIVSHEDNEMMRPYRIGPVQDGQPGTMRQSAVADASAERTEPAEQSNKVYMPLVSND